jgi:prenylcysteine oxidase / farnesylcysteine lyase
VRNCVSQISIYPTQQLLTIRIGAGISGAAAAFWIESFSWYQYDYDVDITVYEKAPSIGGRIKSVHVYDDHFGPVAEVGAATFKEYDETLLQLSQYSNLKLRNRSAVPWSVWDGEHFVLSQGSATLGWWDQAKMVWKYGLSPMRAHRIADEFLGKFRDLFRYEEGRYPFKSLTNATEKAGMTTAAASFGDIYMKEKKIGAPFTHDFVEPWAILSTGQHLDESNGVSAAMGMTIDTEYYIEKGNWELVYGFVHSSSAYVELNTKVVNVSRLNDKYFITTTKSTASGEFSQTSAPYDVVVIAAPYQTTNISMDFPLESTPDTETPYIPVHVTLFTSPSASLSPTAFYKSKDFTVAPNILAARPPAGSDEPTFSSIRRLRNVTYLDDDGIWHTEYLFRVESSSQISDKEITKLSGIAEKEGGEPGARWIYRHVWDHGYLSQQPRRTFDDVELADGLYYMGGIDALWGTMQNAASMGNNVGALIFNKWQKEGIPPEAKNLKF